MDDATGWPACPVDVGPEDLILLAHGEGARAARRLLTEMIAPGLGIPAAMHDAAVLEAGPAGHRLAVTTDSFVVTPLQFPGGDIGSLAVYGTVNDLAVSGAEPRCLTLSMILEEGLPLPILRDVLCSVRDAAARCQTPVVAGDTKVVPRGAVDKIFLNTSGIGWVAANLRLSPERLRPGDRLLVSGPIAQHGVAVMNVRENLGLEPAPRSDCGSLRAAAGALIADCGDDLHSMRDATRGGVAAVLHEWSETQQVTLRLRERDLPLSDEVAAACELLGLDPLHVANEGTLVAAVAADTAWRALQALRRLPGHGDAAIIGEVVARESAPVIIERLLGSAQPLDEPHGAPLPRIC